MAVLRMLHLEVLPLVEHDLLAHLVPGPQADRREERRHLVILVLRPALEGMVVALRADHPDAEEDLGGLLHRRLGVARHAIEIRLRRVIRTAPRGQHLAHYSVVWLVLRDRVANPLAESVGALFSE